MEENSRLRNQIMSTFELEDQNPRAMSPLNLAFIGDGIFDLVIRTYVVGQANQAVNSLHKKVSGIVKAETQSKIINALQEELSETEMAIYKRGRNAKSYSSAKNASLADYRKATGFEALIGYLYLMDETDRMLNLIKKGLELIGENTWDIQN